MTTEENSGHDAPLEEPAAPVTAAETPVVAAVAVDETKPKIGTLIDRVGTLLIKSGLVKQANEFFYNNAGLIQAEFQSDWHQRAALNRFFYTQLSCAPAPSQEQRYALINDGTYDEWLDLFTRKVLPFCIEQQLPKGI